VQLRCCFLIQFALALMKKVKRTPPRPKGVSRGRKFTADSNSVPLTNDARMDKYLIDHAVDPAYGREAGLTAIGVLQARELKFKPALDGIWIPHYDPLTSAWLETKQIRYFDAPIINGKARRFNGPAYNPVEAYFDNHLNWKPIFRSPKKPLWITEGAIKALAAILAGFNTIGLDGVTLYGGENLTPLLRQIVWKDRDVYIVYDSDVLTNPNVKYHREKLARILTGLRAIVHLPDMPPLKKDGKTDLNDLLMLRGGADMLRALCEAAPIFGVEPEYIPNIRSMREVTAMNAKWIWDDYLSLGTITGMSGDPAAGKTFVALAIAAALSNGRQPGSPKVTGDPVTTLYISTENRVETVTKPRFVALGGDLDRLITLDDEISLKDISKIERAIEVSKAQLVVFDPLQSYLTGIDMHRSNETRPILDGLTRLAERKEICVLFLRHLAKQQGGRAIHKGLGSIDITAAMRTEFLIGNRADEPLNKALILIKTNNGVYPPPVAFTITPLTTDIDGSTIKTATLTWKGRSNLTLADLTGSETKSSSKTQVEIAIEYLKKELKDGKRLQSELEQDADVSERTLQKAAKIMQLKKHREGEGGKWTWELPKAGKYTIEGHQQKEKDNAE
jgi:hypothetical protein